MCGLPVLQPEQSFKIRVFLKFKCHPNSIKFDYVLELLGIAPNAARTTNFYLIHFPCVLLCFRKMKHCN